MGPDDGVGALLDLPQARFTAENAENAKKNSVASGVAPLLFSSACSAVNLACLRTMPSHRADRPIIDESCFVARDI